MKTKSFLLGAAALMLATSCSNDEVVKVAENSAAIGFSSFVNNSTRATDNDAKTLDNLQVWGLSARTADGVNPYAVFGGDVVTKGTPNWTYDNTRYWVAGNDYTFTAVAPANATGATVNPGAGMVKGAVESIDFTNNGEVDLLFDAQDVAAKDDVSAYGEVAFNLRHILSRVRFEFKNEMAEGYSIKVTGVTIKGAKKTATFDAVGGAWGEGSVNGDYGFTMPEDAKVANASADSEPSYLFPAPAGTAYTLTFNVELILEDAVTKDPVSIDTYAHTVNLPATEYKLGYSYAFKTVINAQNIDPEEEKNPIKFKADVEPWGEETPTEFPVKTKD